MSEVKFEDWLCKKLTSLDIDNEVYGSYITGILQESDESERKTELQEIMETVIEDSEQLCNDVLTMWKSFHPDGITQEVKETPRNINDIFAAHAAVSSQKAPTTKAKSKKQTDAVKQAVLAMYSDVADEAPENDEALAEEAASHRSSVDAALEIMKNTNVERLAQAEKEERLKKKEESAKKKEQDKINRELQKMKKAERKDKEKKRTQKKERGR